MYHKELEYLKKRIEYEYGTLDCEQGCYVNGRFLSIEYLVFLIDRVDEECHEWPAEKLIRMADEAIKSRKALDEK